MYVSNVERKMSHLKQTIDELHDNELGKEIEKIDIKSQFMDLLRIYNEGKLNELFEKYSFEIKEYDYSIIKNDEFFNIQGKLNKEIYFLNFTPEKLIVRLNDFSFIEVLYNNKSLDEIITEGFQITV